MSTRPASSPDLPAELPSLRVEGVEKRFGDVRAVDDVSFEMGPHELFALVGPSGCGKSTLLRMLAGLHTTRTGTIALGDMVVDDGHRSLPPEARRIGMVFQEHALFPHLSVAKNVGFGVRDGDPTRRVREMLEMVGLADYGERYPHELSGGERQRVALARALAPSPSLVLLDEPFASLDPNLRAKIRDDVVGILRATGTPAVFVTHDQSEALAIGDRIAVMRAGKIVQLDTPERVFHTPSDRFVAAFMGEADFVPAGVARDELGARTLAGVADDQFVMIRPDDIVFVTLSDEGVPDPSDPPPATVIGSEFRGSTWCYSIALASGEIVRSVRSHLTRVPVGTAIRPMLLHGHRPVVVDGD
jgi:iron(III) transport system ATP-binding protein